MKTVGTITEILDLFYKRIDNISIHNLIVHQKQSL